MKTLQRTLVMLLWCVALIASHAQADTITYYHNDLLGSPAAATNETGQIIWREAYRGYGERINNGVPSAPNKVWYTSRHQDEDTGLVYMGARYYDPALGRFLSVDAVGFNEQNVHSFNRYAYANNNPYKFKDPNGLNAVTAVGGLLTESYNLATGQGFNGSMVLGALKDGYNGEGAGFWRSAGEDALSFGSGALGAVAKGVQFAKEATRGALAARVLTEAGELRLSVTAENSIANRAYVSPLTVQETIAGGVRVPDPQGVAGRFMYTVDAAYNKSVGKFEVLVNELNNTIEHALFRSGM